MLTFIYRLLMTFGAPAMLLYWVVSPRYRSHWRQVGERFAFYGRQNPRMQAHPLWIHGTSIGEIRASFAWIDYLRTQDPQTAILVTVQTCTAYTVARGHLPADIPVVYQPYDHPWVWKMFFKRFPVKALIFFEKNYWPELYLQCQKRSIPIVGLSASMSERSLQRWLRVQPWVKHWLSAIHFLAVRDRVSLEQFALLGLDRQRIQIWEDFKYTATPSEAVSLRAQSWPLSKTDFDHIWVAASTHPKEEMRLWKTQARLLAKGLKVLLILVPRHPFRFDEVAHLLEVQGAVVARRSRQEPVKSTHHVYLVDTLGELCESFLVADVAVVAGSFEPIGGHNILEPIMYQCPVVTGPHTFNGQGMIDLFVEHDLIDVVADENELEDVLLAIWQNPQRTLARAQQAYALYERTHQRLQQRFASLAKVLASARLRDIR